MLDIAYQKLVNSAKYTAEGGVINVRISVEGEWVHITVQDNGIGMSSKLQNRVFDTFSQSARSLDRAQGGLGIGLTIVRSIIELHGGSVGAYSPGATLCSTCRCPCTSLPP